MATGMSVSVFLLPKFLEAFTFLWAHGFDPLQEFSFFPEVPATLPATAWKSAKQYFAKYQKAHSLPVGKGCDA